MNSFDDLDTDNGDNEHYMWVDFDNYENIGTSMFSMNLIETTLVINLTTWSNYV